MPSGIRKDGTKLGFQKGNKPVPFREKRLCIICGKSFIATIPWHIYCGSVKDKTGCAYKKNLEWYRSPEHRAWERKYNKTPERRKVNREDKKKYIEANPEYKERQRKLCKEYAKNNRKNNIEKVRKMARDWHHRNGGGELKVIACKECGKLFKQTAAKQEYCGSKTKKTGCSYLRRLYGSRLRTLRKKNVIGSHTEQEWQQKKKEYNYCCAICGISEKELKKKYKDKRFRKLHRDHIIPITKNGTDFIENIQPLCVTCNSKKFNKIYKKIVFCYAVSDIVHIGHIKHFEKAKKLAEKLNGIVVVGLLTDSATMEKKPRPIISFEERMEIIRLLRCVDITIPQKTYSPLGNVKIIKPDVLMESTSHDPKDIEKMRKFVEGYGGKVVVTKYYKGISSSLIKQKIKEQK